jgi:hypothetical protein
VLGCLGRIVLEQGLIERAEGAKEVAATTSLAAHRSVSENQVLKMKKRNSPELFGEDELFEKLVTAIFEG